MSYNRNKRIALDERNRMGLRYVSLLRCITHICTKNKESFKQKLSLLDTGLKTTLDSSTASLKIANSIAQLEGDEGLHSKSASTLQAVVDLSKQNSEDKTSKLKINHSSIGIKLFGWLFSFSAKKNSEHSNSLTKNQIERLFKNAFYEIEPLIEIESEKYHELICKKLKHLQTELAFPPQCRKKTWDSIVDKIPRIRQKIETLQEIQDLVGLRVVTIFDKDIEIIERIIEINFTVIRKYSPKYIDGAGGVSPLHMVIRRKNSSFFVKENRGSLAILAEVQIMTLAQYSFAKISHSLLYKKNLNQGRHSKNSLRRISALLESVDLELSNNLFKK